MSFLNRDVPPRKTPPDDWPLEKQMIAYQKWNDMQGGVRGDRPWDVVNPSGNEEEIDQGIAGDTREATPRKIYRNYFDPPLKNLDPETVPEENLEQEYNHYRERLLEQGDFLSPCDHLTDRERLRWVLELTHKKLDPPTSGGCGIFQLRLSCPDCVREIDREASDDFKDPPLDRLTSFRKRAKNTFGELEDYQQNEEDDLASTWPPGANRIRQLSRTILDRLDSDISQDVIELSEQNECKILGVVDGLRALSWIMGGLIQLYDEERHRAFDTLNSATRMVRVMTNRDPSRHPGRFYDDLLMLIPDVTFVASLIQPDPQSDDELELPDREESTAEEWKNALIEERAVENPPFAEIIRLEPSSPLIRKTHRRWKDYQEYMEVEESRSKRFLQEYIGRTLQFDEDRPGEFLDGDVEPINPDHIDPSQFSNADLFAFVLNDDSLFQPEHAEAMNEIASDENISSPDDSTNPLTNNPLYRQLGDVVSQARERFESLDVEDEEADSINVIYHILEFAKKCLDSAYFYSNDMYFEPPMAGGYLATRELTERVDQILEETNRNYNELKSGVRDVLGCLNAD